MFNVTHEVRSNRRKIRSSVTAQWMSKQMVIRGASDIKRVKLRKSENRLARKKNVLRTIAVITVIENGETVNIRTGNTVVMRGAWKSPGSHRHVKDRINQAVLAMVARAEISHIGQDMEVVSVVSVATATMVAEVHHLTIQTMVVDEAVAEEIGGSRETEERATVGREVGGKEVEVSRHHISDFSL